MLASILPADNSLRAVLFDAVGTLLYPAPHVADAYFTAGAEFGSRKSRDEIATTFSRAIRAAFHVQRGLATNEQLERQRWQEIVLSVFDDVCGERAESLFQSLWDHFGRPEHWQLFDDTAALWRACIDRGMIVGIASNFDERLLTICRGFSLFTNCPHIFVSSRIGFSKPEERFFRAIESSLGLAPHELMLIGDDREKDVAGATRAGWRSWLIER